MPHVKQGGNSVDAVAVAGSKLEAIGLENEHIGQIQVAFTGFGGGELLYGTEDCENGKRLLGDCCIEGLIVPALVDLLRLFFGGLG